MNLMELIEKARELIGGGGIDSLSENAGQLSDIAQGEGNVAEKAQEGLEGLGDAGGDAGDSGDPSGSSRQG